MYQKMQTISCTEVMLVWMLSEAKRCISFPTFPDYIRAVCNLSNEATIEQVENVLRENEQLLMEIFSELRGNYALGKFVRISEWRLEILELSHDECSEWFGYPDKSMLWNQDTEDALCSGVIIARFNGSTYVLEGNHRISALIIARKTIRNVKVYSAFVSSQPIFASQFLTLKSLS